MKSTKFRRITAFTLSLLFLLLSGCTNARAGETPEETPAAAQEASGADTPALLTVTAFDVGKADAFLLRSADHVVIIDTAKDEDGPVLVKFLEEQGITKIDELFLSHFDKDHVGGADALLDAFPVGAVYTTYQSKDSDDIEEFYAALNRRGMTNIVVREAFSYEADGVTYEVFPPEKESYKKDESNNSSLVLRVSAGGKSMLFTGDAEKKRIKELLALDGIKSDVLKMPHHGGFENNLEDLVTAVAPEVTIITSSDEEPESAETMALLNDAGVTTYLTREGRVTILFRDGGLTITQEMN